MTYRHEMALIARCAVNAAGGNEGSPDDSRDLQAFWADPDGASEEVFGGVAGIPFGNFFEEDDDALDAAKDDIMRCVRLGLENNDLAVPDGWDAAMSIGQFTVGIDRQI